jgi:hypothetical protein
MLKSTSYESQNFTHIYIYKTTGKIIVLYILIVRISNKRLKETRFWREAYKGCPKVITQVYLQQCNIFHHPDQHDPFQSIHLGMTCTYPIASPMTENIAQTTVYQDLPFTIVLGVIHDSCNGNTLPLRSFLYTEQSLCITFLNIFPLLGFENCEFSID